MTEPTISTFSVTKGGKVEETYATFQAWNLEDSFEDNLQRLREENLILASTDAWLKEMQRIFGLRFRDTDRHVPLIQLAQGGLPMESWAPILLWHLCFRELLLSDFLETWLFARKQEGILRVRSDDVRDYLGDLKDRGLLTEDWTENTVSRMASGLPTYAADFGLLQGAIVKELAPFHLPEDALLYVLYDLRSEVASTDRLLDDPRWRRFLLSRQEVEQELFRLHQHQRVQFDVAGSLVSLQLPLDSVEAYVSSLV